MLEEDRIGVTPSQDPGAQDNTLPLSDSAWQLNTSLPFLQRKSPLLVHNADVAVSGHLCDVRCNWVELSLQLPRVCSGVTGARS